MEEEDNPSPNPTSSIDQAKRPKDDPGKGRYFLNQASLSSRRKEKEGIE